MDPTTEQWRCNEGDEVFGADDQKVGTVAALYPDATRPTHLVVTKGFFFPTDYYVPTSVVATYEDGRVYLTVAKDEALNQGWDAAPTVGGASAETPEVTLATTASAGAPLIAPDTGMRHGDEEHPGGGLEHRSASGAMAHGVEGDVLRVPVHEEELTATTREREIGHVRITKEVVAEERVLEVPVTEERLRVERWVVDRPGAVEGAFERTTIDVPIRGEEVDVQKEVRVAEEIEVAKEAVQRTERVADTVCHEEVRVEQNVDTTDAARRDAARDVAADATLDADAGDAGSFGEARTP